MLRHLHDLVWRLRLALTRRRVDDEVRGEVETHLQFLIERYIHLGMTPDDARAAARRQFGSALVVREEIHQMNSIGWLEELWNDVRFAIRQLRDTPGFTALAAITLALGIGANSAIFALVDATLIRPLPLPDPDRLVMVWERTPMFQRALTTSLNVRDWQERNRTFTGIAGFFNYARRLSAADGSVEQIPAQQVTANFFNLLGAHVVAGRTFVSSDIAMPPNVVVLSEGLWRSHFGGDAGLIGRIIQLDGQPFTVVGVVAADFQGIPPANLWTVWAELPGMDARGLRFMRAVGRLKPGVPLEAAQSDLARVAAELAREYPAANKDTSVNVEPLRDALVEGEVRSTAMLFLGVVGFVLLLCCANVANLLLTRTAGRARELAVRSALGAGRPRIVRQLLTESVVLAAGGGALGLIIGFIILRLAPALIPQGLLPLSVVLQFDSRVALFCAVTAAAGGVLFGLAPAWQATGTSLVEVLTAEGRGTTKAGGHLRSVLVAGEIAAAVLLLCGAGLLLRTLTAMRDVDPGYRNENVLTLNPSLDYGLKTSMFGSEDALRQFFERVEHEVRNLPNVENAGWGTGLPLGGFFGSDFEIVGDEPSAATRLRADRQLVSPAYLSTLGVPILAGRGFTEQDTANSPPVCIVSQAVVRQHFGGRNPIGMRIVVRRQALGPPQPEEREIIGVAGDVRRDLSEAGEARSIYVPIAQNPWSYTVLIVKPRGGPADALIPAVRAAVARVDRRVPLAQIRTLDSAVGQASARPRFRAVLVTTFAALALLLALVGVFGVLAYSVQQRRREFGVRIALGASTRQILQLVLGNAGRLIGTGALAGLVLAAIFAQSISAFLFGVRPLDPLTFAAVIAVLGTTATIASAIPAVRATQVDPIIAFRND